ncbi:MAG TPA: hypothetical protein VNN72_22325 [Polyangiaceae bacterium]|nr:hypothetical protein [Polyangiaceae bacterium]
MRQGVIRTQSHGFAVHRLGLLVSPGSVERRVEQAAGGVKVLVDLQRSPKIDDGLIQATGVRVNRAEGGVHVGRLRLELQRCAIPSGSMIHSAADPQRRAERGEQLRRTVFRLRAASVRSHRHRLLAP